MGSVNESGDLLPSIPLQKSVETRAPSTQKTSHLSLARENLVTELALNMLSALKTSSTVQGTLPEITSLDGGENGRITHLRKEISTFIETAKEKGMSGEQIDRHIQFISQHIINWVGSGQDVRPTNAEKDDLAHSIEFIKETGTVVTHFKNSMGEGAFARVTQSIVTVSSTALGGTHIAHKIPLENASDSPEIRRKKAAAVQREGEITRKFNNSENVRGCYRVDGTGILLAGMAQTLDDHLGNLSSFNPAQKIELAKQLINGMTEIHAQGYVHNDLTTKNCFISYEGVCKIGDLGSAMEIEGVSTVPVNLYICSPQQLAGKVFNGRTLANTSDDVFAMGLLLYIVEYGSPSDFVTNDSVLLLREAIKKRDGLLGEILASRDPGIILGWNGNSPLENSFRELAENYLTVKKELAELHLNYLQSLNSFLQKFTPTTDLGRLAKQMLQPDSTVRISAENAKKAPLESTSNNIEKAPLALINPVSDGYTLEDEIQKEPHLPAKQEGSHPAQTVQRGYVDVLDPRPTIVNTTSSNTRATVSSDPELLVNAVRLRDTDLLQSLIMRGVDICRWRNSSGETLLHLAGKEKSSNTVIEFLLAQGADINAKDVEGATPLYCALKKNNVLGGKLLLARGANFFEEDKLGNPLLVYHADAGEIAYLDTAASEQGGINYTLSDVRYLDENRLLIGQATKKIDPTFTAWFMNQAITLQYLREPGVSAEAKRTLTLLTLNAFDKAAPHGLDRPKALSLQRSPLYPSDVRYHRSSLAHEISAGAHLAFCDLLRSHMSSTLKRVYFSLTTLHLIHSPLAIEAIKRSLNVGDQLLALTELDKGFILNQINQTIKNKNNKIIIDFTNFVNSKGGGLHALQEFMGYWEANFSSFQYNKQISVIGIFTDSGRSVLYTPNDYNLSPLLRKSGFVLSPDELKEAWLSATPLEIIFKLHGLSLPEATLATLGTTIPIVLNSINDLSDRQSFLDFKKAGAKETGIPYQKTLIDGTVQVLEGLKKHPASRRSGGIEAAFEKHGLQEFLQISYFKILNELATARLRIDTMIPFLNAIGSIHQEVQNILAILAIDHGYGPDDFGRKAAERLTNTQDPVVPVELGLPDVRLKPSAMHGLASTLAAVEALKGTDRLNVAILKDTYYEGADLIESFKKYHSVVLDGDQFAKNVPIDQCFNKPPPLVDLFVCEFHHNISVTRQEYYPENVLGQLLAMHRRGMLATPCTVLIDTTIDLEHSDEMKALLHHPEVMKLIQEGKLNIVFLRSAQKFDMLGLDNYYGGVTTTINNRKDFDLFNARMETPEDQQAGLAYQGMTHLQMHAADSVENYRKAIMENCRRLYETLPEKMIYKEGSNYPVQISRIGDKRLVFLDIKTPGYPELASKILSVFGKLMVEKKLPITHRSSFGFATTNITRLIEGQIRLSPGLEGEEIQLYYTRFFTVLQSVIDEVLKNSGGLGDEMIEEALTNGVNALKLE